MKLEHFYPYYTFFNKWQKPIYKDFAASYNDSDKLHTSFGVTIFATTTWFETTSKYTFFESLHSSWLKKKKKYFNKNESFHPQFA
jgi:hypothetical protein